MNPRNTSFAVAALVLAAGSAMAQISIADGTFADADWSTFKVQDTTPTAAATGASGQIIAGGVPGAYRATTHSWDIASGGVSISFAHLRSGTLWDPSARGAITGVSIEYDAICFSAPFVSAIGTGLVAEQNGEFYAAVLQPFGGTALLGNGWTHFSGSFVFADFVRMGGGANNLDFSDAGAPIQFGYYTANGGSGADFHNTAELGLDNYNLQIVPAPGAGVLMIAGLGLVRRRR